MPVDTHLENHQSAETSNPPDLRAAQAAYREQFAKHQMAEVEFIAASTSLNAAYSELENHFAHIYLHRETIDRCRQQVLETVAEITHTKNGSMYDLAKAISQDSRLIHLTEEKKSSLSQIHVHETLYFDIDAKIDQLLKTSTAAYTTLETARISLGSFAVVLNGVHAATDTGIVDAAKNKHRCQLQEYSKALAQQETASLNCLVAGIDAARAKKLLSDTQARHDYVNTELAHSVERVAAAQPTSSRAQNAYRGENHGQRKNIGLNGLFTEVELLKNKLTFAIKCCNDLEAKALEAEKSLTEARVELEISTQRCHAYRNELNAAINAQKFQWTDLASPSGNSDPEMNFCHIDGDLNAEPTDIPSECSDDSIPPAAENAVVITAQLHSDAMTQSEAGALIL